MSSSYNNEATSGRDDAYTSGRGTEANSGYAGEQRGYAGEQGSGLTGHSSHAGEQRGYAGEQGSGLTGHSSHHHQSGSELRGSDLQPEGSRVGGDYSSDHTGGIPKVHEGHVSAGSQLNPTSGGFSGVDMAAETAKFDNAYGAVPGHREGGYTSGPAAGSSLTQEYSSTSGTGHSHGEHGLTSGTGHSHGEHGLTSGTGHSHGEHGLTGHRDTTSTTGTSGFQQSSGGAYQGSTEHQHSSHGTHHGSHSHGSDNNESGHYTGSKKEQERQMQEEKKEAAAEKKEELKHRNEHGESKMSIAKDEYNKAGQKADHETPDGHKPGMLEKIKAAVKSI